MKLYELRLAALHARNANHLKKLVSFMDNDLRRARIDEVEQNLIKDQISLMQSLQNVLEARMKLHNIPL